MPTSPNTPIVSDPLTDNGSTEPFYWGGGELGFYPTGDFGGGTLTVEYDTSTDGRQPSFANPGTLGEPMTTPSAQVIDVANVWLRATLAGATAPNVPITWGRTKD